MLACPGCRKRTFTRHEISTLGGAKCPACGQLARLDSMSRALVACTLAIILWSLLLYGNLFYSGFLFVFSTIVIVVGWPLLLAIAMPLLALEKSPGGVYLDRRQNIAMLALLVLLAIGIDGLLSYRSDADKADADTMSPRVETTPVKK